MKMKMRNKVGLEVQHTISVISITHYLAFDYTGLDYTSQIRDEIKVYIYNEIGNLRSHSSPTEFHQQRSIKGLNRPEKNHL